MMNKTHSSTALSVTDLQLTFRGRIIAPGDPEYDSARATFYGGIDRRPSVIISVR